MSADAHLCMCVCVRGIMRMHEAKLIYIFLGYKSTSISEDKKDLPN